MTNSEDIGYGKPPKRTQFTKGKSGNPAGRPKGSQNLATILNRIGRQRIKVTENGRSRQITKFEAMLLQLVNKAVGGDINAVNQLRYWTQWLEESLQKGGGDPVLNENDEAVFAGMVARIRESEDLSVKNAVEIGGEEPPEEEG